MAMNEKEYHQRTVCTQDLKACGCTAKEIERFFGLNHKSAQCSFLTRKRQALLEMMHQVQTRIDRADYLIFQIQNKDGKDGSNDGSDSKSENG